MSGNDVLSRYRKLDCCTVSDALDRLEIDGVALGLSPLTCKGAFVGRAVTMQLNLDDGRPTGQHLGTRAVDQADSDTVIVVAHNARMDVSGWGGVLSRGAVRQGVQAVIVDGACRDVDESEEVGLPIFARNSVPRTARGRVIETAFNEPVLICGISVRSGDVVFADGSGVAFVPLGRVEEVLAVAERIFAREQLMIAKVEEGVPMKDVMGADYDSMLKGKNSGR